MKFYLSISFLIILSIIYTFYVSQFSPKNVPTPFNRDRAPLFYDYKGVINVHTSLGRGASSPLEVVESGKKADLDFLILTDELSKYESRASVSGYYDKLLVMEELELHYLDSRVTFISNSQETKAQLLNQMYEKDVGIHHTLTDYLSQSTHQTKSLMLLTHPFINGQLTWTGEFPTGFDGIDLLNPRSISSKTWYESKWSVLWSLFLYPFNSDYSFMRLFTEPILETVLWDEVLKKRKIFAFANTDVTAKSIPFPGYLVQFPSYLKSFQIVSNHILFESELTGLYTKDREKIFYALKNGHFYISFDLLGDPFGFYVFIEEIDKKNLIDKKYLMGSEIVFKKDALKLFLHLPHRPKDFFEIVIYRNGEKVFTGNETDILYPIEEKGTYRATVRISSLLPFPEGKRWFTWIYTNPFFIR